MAAILVVKNVAAHYAVYVFELHVTCQCYHQIGVYVHECTCIIYTNVTVLAPHSEMEVWSGTAFIWDSSCCLQRKCMGRPGWATWNIGWSCCTVLCIARWVQACNVQHAANVLCVSDHNWTVRGGRQALYSVHISWVYRDFWVCSALNFMMRLENAQDCCQVGTTSFKWGAVMFVLWDIPYTSGMILSWRRNHVKSCNCNQWNMAKGQWTRTPVTPPDGAMHRYLQNTRFENVHHPCCWWLFGHVMSKVFLVHWLHRMAVWMHISAMSPVSCC